MQRAWNSSKSGLDTGNIREPNRVKMDIDCPARDVNV